MNVSDQQKAQFEEKLQKTNESCIENVVWEKSEDKNGGNSTETAIEVCFDDDIEEGKFQENTDGQKEEHSSQVGAESFHKDENFVGDKEDDSQNLTENMEIPARKLDKVAVNKDGKIETIDLTVEFDSKSNGKEVQRDKERDSQKSMKSKKDAKGAEKSKQQEELIDLTVEFDEGKKNEQAGETKMETSTEDETKKERDEERRKRANEWKKREPRVLLYEKLKGNEAMPLIGIYVLSTIK